MTPRGTAARIATRVVAERGFAHVLDARPMLFAGMVFADLGERNHWESRRSGGPRAEHDLLTLGWSCSMVGDVLTLPNFLTFLRIIAIPAFLVLLTRENYAAAFILFLAAGITDTVDGAIARLTNTHSSLGAILDPMADKLLLLSSFIVFGIIGAVPQWLVVVVVSRDIIVLAGYIVLFFIHQVSMPVDPSRLGKVNTFFELFTIGFALMHLARPFLPLDLVNLAIQSVTAATAAASGVQYVYRGLLWHQEQGSREAGLP